ncbi:hypothetical protein TNCT_131401 [Trichonephila clavata]|uniref:Uncharacterized protein n=1 Tax=Trichonephila clavata TaxID=2740835 RepID=A0A8X6FR25_TRICU|nr:hypothetical protein TNCT_131401 [Trichonephila clavata]
MRRKREDSLFTFPDDAGLKNCEASALSINKRRYSTSGFRCPTNETGKYMRHKGLSILTKLLRVTLFSLLPSEQRNDLYYNSVYSR